MSIKLELEMRKPVRSWLRAQRMLVKSEFSTPWGACDVVGCLLDPNRVRQRLELRQREAIGPQFRVSLLLVIPDERRRRSITFDRLFALAGPYATRGKVQDELDRLIARRFVRRTARGSLRRNNGCMPMHERLVAVELKLSRIEDVLAQARANLGFADESFIALPLARARRFVCEDRSAVFRREGIGILGVSRRRVEVALAARRQRAGFRVTQVHAVERFWRAHVTGS